MMVKNVILLWHKNTHPDIKLRALKTNLTQCQIKNDKRLKGKIISLPGQNLLHEYSSTSGFRLP